jgi:hypothetical protein
LLSSTLCEWSGKYSDPGRLKWRILHNEELPLGIVIIVKYRGRLRFAGDITRI